MNLKASAVTLVVTGIAEAWSAWSEHRRKMAVVKAETRRKEQAAKKRKQAIRRNRKGLESAASHECNDVQFDAALEVLRHNSTGKADRLARLQAELDAATKREGE